MVCPRIRVAVQLLHMDFVLNSCMEHAELQGHVVCPCPVSVTTMTFPCTCTMELFAFQVAFGRNADCRSDILLLTPCVHFPPHLILQGVRVNTRCRKQYLASALYVYAKRFAVMHHPAAEHIPVQRNAYMLPFQQQPNVTFSLLTQADFMQRTPC